VTDGLPPASVVDMPVWSESRLLLPNSGNLLAGEWLVWVQVLCGRQFSPHTLTGVLPACPSCPAVESDPSNISLDELLAPQVGSHACVGLGWAGGTTKYLQRSLVASQLC
jgi:hypothetical protein